MKRFFLLLLALSLLLSGCVSPSAAPTEGDVELAYLAAAEVYDWFNLCSLPTAGEAVETDGQSWRAVRYAGISTYADLEEKVRSLFAPELADQILSENSSYRDLDGKLYSTEGARGSNLTLKERAFSVEQTDEDCWAVTITFYADSWDWERPAATIGYSRQTLHYESTPEGWRFTDFCPSDDLDLDADTVFSLTYTTDAYESMNCSEYSDLQLMLYSLHADGALAEGVCDDLFFRFLDYPDAVVAALAPLHIQWRTEIVRHLTGAAVSWHRDSGFAEILSGLTPADDGEQSVLDALQSAYEEALTHADAPMAVETEFSLLIPGEPQTLTLGAQEGTFPWGYDLEGTVISAGPTDTYGTAYEMDCGDIQLAYVVSPEDGTEYLYKLSTTVPYDRSEGYLCTPRGLYCGYDETNLRKIYIPAVKLETYEADGYDGFYVYEPGGDAGCKHLLFYLKDGTVAKIEAEDLMDGRILPESQENG